MSDPKTGTAGSLGNDPASQAFIADPEGTAEHRHTYTLLWWHYGPHGPQDVHVHSCDGDDCKWVLIGPGRDCAGPEDHEEHKLRSSPVGLKRSRQSRHRSVKRFWVILEVDHIDGHHEAVIRNMAAAAGRRVRLLEIHDA